MKKSTKFIVSCGTLLVTMSMTSAMVFAATPKATFAQTYEKNQTTETQLLSQINTANVPSGNPSALLTTIQDLSTQIATLYATEQNLIQQKTNIPPMATQSPSRNSLLIRLQKERQTILKKNEAAWQLVTKYYHHPHQKGLLSTAIRDHQNDSKKLAAIDARITKVNKGAALDNWSTHPYHNALPVLEATILRLQNAEIHYTKELNAIIQNNGQTTTGATYGTSTAN